jgi:hypothetical protein
MSFTSLATAIKCWPLREAAMPVRPPGSSCCLQKDSKEANSAFSAKELESVRSAIAIALKINERALIFS